MSDINFRNLFFSLPLPAFVIQDGCFQLVNNKLAEMAGYKPEELFDKPFEKLVHPDDRATVVQNNLWRLQGKEIPGEYEFKALNRQGETVYLQGFFSVVEYSGSSAVLGQVTEVTGQKRTEEDLDLQKAYFQKLFESAPAGILMLDENDIIVRANKGFEKMFQYSAREVKGRCPNDVIVPPDFTGEGTTLSGSILRGEVIQQETVRCRKDGSVVDVHILGYPIEFNGRLTGIFAIYLDISRRKRMERKLDESRRALNTLISNLPGIAYRCQNEPGWTMKYVSEGCRELTGYKAEEFYRFSYNDLIHPADREMVWEEVQRAIRKQEPFQLEYRIKTKDGQEKWVWEKGRAVSAQGSETVLEGLITDVTKLKRVEEALRASEAKYRELADSLPEVIFELDAAGNITFVNRNAYKLFGYSEEDVTGGMDITKAVIPAERHRVKESFRKLLRGEKTGGNEYTALRKDGSTFPVTVHASVIFNREQPVGVRGIIVDISERKEAEEKLRFLSLHDSLTGLYNRAFFEHEMRRLEDRGISAGIIVCDVDGLKLANDTMGHDAGDAMLLALSGILKKCFRGDDIIARIGGDEFAVLLPGVGQKGIKKACTRIYDAISEYNAANTKLPLSISVGYAYGSNVSDMGHLFKEADNNMYREKLHRSRSARSSIVQTLMKALEARDYITEGHTDRIQCMVVDLAREAGLPETNMSDLRLLARFHDIGKVGISDSILFKRGPLSDREVKEMQRHSEIGHRIALSAPDLVPISDWILKHHEWWNGGGYPLGLKGEDIPVECRILAIADAFDAITSNRPYRKALSWDEAKGELRKCAGSQFDPELVKKFLCLLEEKCTSKHCTHSPG